MPMLCAYLKKKLTFKKSINLFISFLCLKSSIFSQVQENNEPVLQVFQDSWKVFKKVLLPLLPLSFCLPLFQPTCCNYTDSFQFPYQATIFFSGESLHTLFHSLMFLPSVLPITSIL